MIGGTIVDIRDKGEGIVTFTVVENRDRIKVDVKNPKRLPEVGSKCWWQAGKIYCEGDTLILEKHGYSYVHGHWPRSVK